LSIKLEKERLTALLQNGGVPVITLDKRTDFQNGNYLSHLRVGNSGAYFSTHNWELEMIEVSLSKQISLEDRVEKVLNILQKDRATTSHNRVTRVDEARKEKSENGFLYRMKFSSEVVRNE
jgi:hypothetical protein